jgi:hypothetical protein
MISHGLAAPGAQGGPAPALARFLLTPPPKPQCGEPYLQAIHLSIPGWVTRRALDPGLRPTIGGKQTGAVF